MILFVIFFVLFLIMGTMMSIENSDMDRSVMDILCGIILLVMSGFCLAWALKY